MKKILFLLSFLALFSISSFGQTDTAGTYVPTVLTTQNTSGSVTIGVAHWSKNHHEVTVWGRVGFAHTVLQAGTRTLYTLSLPVPSHLIFGDDATGTLVASQNNTHDNVPGYIIVLPSGSVAFIWNSTATGNVNTYYQYTYTEKP